MATFIALAVGVLPLMHTGQAMAGERAGTVADLCTVDVCGCCPDTGADLDAGCCDDHSDPEAPVPCDDAPCDCPCCGKVLPVVSMMSPFSPAGLFWDPSPTPSWTPHMTRPQSAALCVAIQPPIA
ncbi:MAG: hypothetical protein ACIAXF_00995 [Phycisphaerales bacterium JB063]